MSILNVPFSITFENLEIYYSRVYLEGQVPDHFLQLRRRNRASSFYFSDRSRRRLNEWCRRKLGAAGFEAVHAGFQGGDVCFEGVDALVELGK